MSSSQQNKSNPFQPSQSSPSSEDYFIIMRNQRNAEEIFIPRLNDPQTYQPESSIQHQRINQQPVQPIRRGQKGKKERQLKKYSIDSQNRRNIALRYKDKNEESEDVDARNIQLWNKLFDIELQFMKDHGEIELYTMLRPQSQEIKKELIQFPPEEQREMMIEEAQMEKPNDQEKKPHTPAVIMNTTSTQGIQVQEPQRNEAEHDDYFYNNSYFFHDYSHQERNEDNEVSGFLLSFLPQASDEQDLK